MNDTKKFLEDFENQYKPLFIKTSKLYWEASTSGKKELWEKLSKAQLELIHLFRDREKFNTIKKLREDHTVDDPTLIRQLSILYREFLPNQFDIEKLETITNLQNKIEEVFTLFRAEIDGHQLTDNEVDNILKTETDNYKLQSTWEASKKVGELIEPDLLNLVKLRNEQAKSLGFTNYHEMSLVLNEFDPAELDIFFNKLDQISSQKFIEIKAKIDYDLSKRYKIPTDELMPWHYQGRFFQEAPAIYSLDFDNFFKGKDLIDIVRKYYSKIGLSIDDLISRSDLFERQGKNQHAYCINIDRERDIRVLCNVKDNSDWMGTLLHEFGHAVYDKYIDLTLPFLLREVAHIFVTEAIAQLFGKLAFHPVWIKKVLNVPESIVENIRQDAINLIKMNQIIFARWVLVMYNFEKALYKNPDDDLTKLWWDLHYKYLRIIPPERKNKPDWATKIHIVTSPCYYHNYLLGEVLASQLNNFIHINILNSDNIWDTVIIDKNEVGDYLINNLFRFGALYHWKEIIKISTGEDLTTKYYKNQYIS